MKISAIQPRLNPNIHINSRNQNFKVPAYTGYDVNFKGMSGSITGLCGGVLTGLFGSIGLTWLGLPICFYAALGLMAAGGYGGIKLGDKLEDKIERAVNNNSKE